MVIIAYLLSRDYLVEARARANVEELVVLWHRTSTPREGSQTLAALLNKR